MPTFLGTWGTFRGKPAAARQVGSVAGRRRAGWAGSRAGRKTDPAPEPRLGQAGCELSPPWERSQPQSGLLQTSLRGCGYRDLAFDAVAEVRRRRNASSLVGGLVVVVNRQHFHRGISSVGRGLDRAHHRPRRSGPERRWGRRPMSRPEPRSRTPGCPERRGCVSRSTAGARRDSPIRSPPPVDPQQGRRRGGTASGA